MATARDADARLLRVWRDAAGQSVPADELAAAAQVDREALASRVQVLRGAGYDIAGPMGPQERYHLVAAPPHLVADDLCATLAPDALVGREILVFEETDSTNDLAARAGRDGVAEGLVIFAESQRAGRGRLGRQWASPPRTSLLFSALLRPRSGVERWPELTFCAALSVAEAAERYSGQPASIKWPNDVLVAGRKVAGILLECHHGQPPGFVVIGIGLNVLQAAADFPAALQDRAGSLAMFRSEVDAPGPLERRAVAAAVLTRLGELYVQWPSDFATILADCQRRGCQVPP